jgi:predicted dehydrogenase
MISMPSFGTGFTILGSGFGLYGYLPALVELGVSVALPVRYRSTLETRPELTQYLPKVTWRADAEQALRGVEGVVVALRPDDQAGWIPRLARMDNIRQIILEKPVAPDPQAAALMLALLHDSGKRYRVGYTFRLMPWAQRLREVLAEAPDGISLDWHFLAHHYRADLANWKRFTPSGGGALRFFGIHLIALLAELGYNDVSDSTTKGASDAEAECWQATLVGRDLCPFRLEVNSRIEPASFRIAARLGDRTRVLAEQRDPFASAELAVIPSQDPRVSVLQQLYRSFDEADDLDALRQKNIVALWAQVECKSRFD